MVAYINYCLVVDNPSLKETHFLRGSFSVTRTEKDFSDQPTDFVIEETQNAVAASTGGISNFTDSVGARKRWCLTHNFRTSNNTKILDNCCMKKAQDVSAELQSDTALVNSKMLRNLKNGIISCINLFSSALDNNTLFNISTGKGAKPETVRYLLSIESYGKLNCVSRK